MECSSVRRFRESEIHLPVSHGDPESASLPRLGVRHRSCCRLGEPHLWEDLRRVRGTSPTALHRHTGRLETSYRVATEGVPEVLDLRDRYSAAKLRERVCTR